jgi:hypothetical protein
MKKVNYNDKIIITKNNNKCNINTAASKYLYDKIIRPYFLDSQLITIEFINNSKEIQKYLNNIYKSKNFIDKITYIGIENIKKDIIKLIEYEKLLKKLENELNPEIKKKNIQTSLKYEGNVNVELDMLYFLYIKKYGPPENGEFDPILLNELKCNYQS